MSMISIAVVSQKGGVSKTTLMTGFAAYAAGEGLRAWIIDMDPLNASAFRWGEERAARHPEAPIVRVEMAHTPLTYQRALDAARKDGAKVVLTDTPQGTGEPHYSAIAGAHLVLIPCKPNFFDANAILVTLQRAAKENRSAHVVFVDVEPGDKADDVDNTQAALKAAAKDMGLPQPSFCPYRLTHSVEHPHAAMQGLAASETAANKTAGRDMKALARWALEQGARAAPAARVMQNAGGVTSIKERTRQRAAGRS